MQAAHLLLRLAGAQVEGAADEEGGRLPDVRPGVVEPGVEALLDQLDQAGGHQVVVVHGLGVIADGGGVAHHHEHVADAQGMRRQQVALDAQQVAPAGGEVQRRSRRRPAALDQLAHRPGAHAHARHRAVGDVDHVRAGFRQQAGAGQELVGGETARRVHLDGDDELALRRASAPARSSLRRRPARALALRALPGQARWRDSQPSGMLSSARRMAAMCCGVVPQQPPTRLAPASQKARAYSPKYSGLAGYMMRPPTCSGQPALGMTEKRASGAAWRIWLQDAADLRRPAGAVDADHVRARSRPGTGRRSAGAVAQQGAVVAGEGHARPPPAGRRPGAAALDGLADLVQVAEGFDDQQVSASLDQGLRSARQRPGGPARAARGRRAPGARPAGRHRRPPARPCRMPAPPGGPAPRRRG